MKIGIYNRYWNTCGGGENYTGSIAELLSQDHDVELISVEPVDWDRIQSRLRLDLARCTTRQWPNEPCARLSPLSAQYDLFVNSTYSSSMMPRSDKSALICYFPHRIDSFTNLRFRTTQWIKEILSRLKSKRFEKDPDRNSIFPVAGVFSTEQDGRAWAGPEAMLAVSGERPKMIRIPLWPDAYNDIQSINADGRELSWQIMGRELCIEPPPIWGGMNLLTLVSNPMSAAMKGVSQDTRELGVCIDTRGSAWEDSTAQFSREMSNVSPQESLSSYTRIISISEFTTEWIDRRWHLSSFELPPPIDTDEFTSDPSLTKERIILSVGRFFAGGHNKKHHKMAKAFIRMRKERRIPEDWRLIFVGSRHREHPSHLAYFDKLVELCAGHPIDILPDLPFAELQRHYRRASIYWHAAGWGEGIEQFPERFEHFGMTTCEAMACGCVPVVFDAAGQQEIVASSEIGFRFSDYETLARQMETLTNAEPAVLFEIGKKAQASISRYARSSFPAKVRNAFRDLAY
jgi:hypothetical protein